ncbi:MAG: hypothetical protein GY839_14480, partial [candidate division Zixibacteria bacterium]|nr:hypothetical protein [candidate division Zixibacteria bacterium]
FKWQQFPDLEPTGIDVCASNQWILGQWLLADDFLCTQYGPITEIKVWGSWYDDILPAAPPTFVLSFHRDIPANENPNGPYSQPGELLWLDTLNVYDEILFAGNLEEGFLLPPEDYYPIGDTQCWLYRFTDFDDPFIQQGTPEEPIVYWLDVQVIIPMPDVAVFGWKTSLDHWNDDAVWINGIEPTDPLAVWHELIYPEQHPMYPQSIDLAFELLGESQEPPLDTCTYYKQPYPDYAPNGMPDFDQKQDAWTGATGGWSYCGPVALANCFWWFDSKFEPSPVDPRPFWPDPTSPGMNDGYPLVTSYDPGGIWDDHDMNNVMPFVDSLALYSNCNPTTPGTFVLDLVNGANTWLNTQLLGANYTVTPHPIPPFELIRDEVLISQDVILLLGFYEFLPSGECNRLGGHYVTVAGVCEEEWQLCLSDPWYDRNEGEPPSGSAHGAGVHNDAHHVSGPHGTIHHDPYNVALNIPPACIPIGGPPPIIELADYPDSYPDIANFDFQNQTDPPVDPQPYTGGDIFTFVDYAIIICPVEPEPDIDVAPDTVEYEQCIETDTIYTAQFQVCNVGTAPLMVNGITCDLGFVSVVNTMPIVIPATGCVDIDIQINTTGITSGAYMGDFHVNSSDPDEPVVDEPHIRVDVVEQDIAVAPDSLYHQQDINTIVNYPTDFTIYNNGDCPLSYTVMYVPTWATLAGITGYIPPSGNDPIDVQINTNGLSAGTYIDSIRIDSDDPDTPILYKPKIVLEVVEESTWLAYLAGDANMFNGTWPPSVIGSDVTYLVNYFRSMPSSQPCFMFNAGALIAPPYFWASADANGDCLIIGSDVTKLVTYFRGLTTISNCSDFPPDYPPIPPVMPPGWPNCQTPPPALKTVIPSETDK